MDAATLAQPLRQIREVFEARAAELLFQQGAAVPGADEWLLAQLLGRGGFGEVWLAKKRLREEWRAVKFCTHPVARTRLATHETNIIGHVLKHAADCGACQNIVPLLDYKLDGATPWLMYEYVPGNRTLVNVIEESGRLAIEHRLAQLVNALQPVAQAVGELHHMSVPIVHRDLKPHNVLMDGATPRITDFGIGGAAVVAAISDTTGGLTELRVQLPSFLQRTGTLLYASPEQLFGSPPSPRDDVYALGVIAYQLLTGDLKYAPGTDADDDLRDLRVPDELITLVHKSVSINPERRPKDGIEWGNALADWKRKATGVCEVFAPRSLAVEVWGNLFARAAGEGEREWSLVATTPTEVAVAPGRIYAFVIDAPVTEPRLRGLKSLAGIPSLRSLSLRDCKQLSDAGLAHLKPLISLRSLSLRGCEQLTDAGLEPLKSLTNLRALTLAGARHLTPSALADLRAALPKCRIQVK
jgi:serine/threonine protein kinase